MPKLHDAILRLAHGVIDVARVRVTAFSLEHDVDIEDIVVVTIEQEDDPGRARLVLCERTALVLCERTAIGSVIESELTTDIEATFSTPAMPGRFWMLLQHERQVVMMQATMIDEPDETDGCHDLS